MYTKKAFLAILFFLGLSVSFLNKAAAQSEEEDLLKKNISDTLLRSTRSLVVPESFNAQKVLQLLFPGKYYNLSKDKYRNELISWECKTCKPQQYIDVNEDGVPSFPFKEGVATRLINEMDYTDSTGVEYKVISFNHSQYDADGGMTSRFTGGLLGLAKFMKTGNRWKLRIFQPAIRAYGAFSSCPTPKLLLIGKGQYAFMIKHSNGGGGGPFDGAYFLIAGANGSYQQMMAAYGIERTESGENFCSWTSTFTVPPSKKTYFRDIVITIKGTFYAGDSDNIPDEIKAKINGLKKGSFTIEQRYVYRNGKGYELQKPVKAEVGK